MYLVFVRNWWTRALPGSRYFPGLEPCPGRKRTLRRNVKTQEEARAICAVYNATHKPGPLSRMAEYTDQ